jgi:hypothetical protein
MEKVENIQLYSMKTSSFLSKLFNSRLFYMFGIFVVFIGIALENVMRVAGAEIDASGAGKFFMVIPISVLLLLISAFLIVMKRRWADFPAVALLFLGLILHRPVFSFEKERGFLSRISDLPFNYFFYLACAFLIVFLVIQIKKNKYRISLK